MTPETWKWISAIATGLFSVVAAYSRLRPKEQEPLYARIATIGAVFSFILMMITQSVEQVDRTEKAREAALAAERQAAAANETLRQIRRAQTILRSIEFGPLFDVPSSRPPLKSYANRLFEIASQLGVGKLRPGGDLVASSIGPEQEINSLDVRPNSRFDPASLGYPEAAKFLRNLGVKIEVYAPTDVSILDEKGHLRRERPGPAFNAWSEVTLPHTWRINREGLESTQTQWLNSDPTLWHRTARVDSIEDFLQAEVLIRIAAADNDNLDIRSPSDRMVSDLLGDTRFSAMMLRVNERLIWIDRFREASGTEEEGGYYEVYRLPESEDKLFSDVK